MPPIVKVCVLGSTAVGKTQLINQFVCNRFDENHEPTDSKGTVFHCSTLLNGTTYHLKLIDMPAIKEFPVDTLAEWNLFQGPMLRTAHAYIFVFDLNSPSTFYYVKVIRDQLFESRNMHNVPVWVVGNKADLCTGTLAVMRGHRHEHHHHHHHHHHHYHHNQYHNYPRPLLHSGLGQHSTHSPLDDLTPAFKDLANLVRKQWKCNYLECSAKYNWRIVPLFREIVKNLDSCLPWNEVQSSSQSHHTTSSTLKENQSFRASVKVVVHSPPGSNDPLNRLVENTQQSSEEINESLSSGNQLCIIS